jgi:hypothetical protein
MRENHKIYLAPYACTVHRLYAVYAPASSHTVLAHAVELTPIHAFVLHNARIHTYKHTTGHLEVVQFLSANRVEGGSVRAINTAALNGHLDVVAWLHANRKEGATEKAMDNAAKNG